MYLSATQKNTQKNKQNPHNKKGDQKAVFIKNLGAACGRDEYKKLKDLTKSIKYTNLMSVVFVPMQVARYVCWQLKTIWI